jgi:hypothetical protein
MRPSCTHRQLCALHICRAVKTQAEIGWQKHAEDMKTDADRYGSLSKEEKEIEALVENTGWTVERARWLYETHPGAAKFLAHLAHP